MLGTYVLSSGFYDAYYNKALKARTLVVEEFNKAFSKYDVIIGPTAPTTAFKIGEKTENPLEMYLSDICTVPVNIAGLPAVSVPCGKDANGLPIGAIVWGFIFMLLTAFIISHGTAGIEKMSTILMPILFVLLIGLMIRSCTLPGASEGIKYMLHVDFSTINGTAILTALGQAFFSLSLGMGVMITYASYLSSDDNLVSNTGIVCVLDTLVALFAGFMIIPAVFATGIAPGMGGGFAFATLAGVFMAIPGGQFMGMLFYFLLFFAAVTSSTSILEGTVAFLTEEKGMERKKALVGCCIIMEIVGVLYLLSQVYMNLKGIWISKDGLMFPIFGDFLEYLTDRLLLPLGAFFTTFFVGWIWGPENSIKEATGDGRNKFALAKPYAFVVKFIDPIAIGAIIIAGMVFGMAIS